MANNKKTKLFRREYIPLVIAFLVLVLLIVALVFTIMNKPKQEEPKKRTENTLRTEEISVGDLSDECEGYDITKLSEEAKNVSLVYEVIDDYYRGQMYCLSKDVNGDGIVTLDDLCDDIGYALKMKINGLTHNLKVIVTNEETNEKKEFTKEEYDKQGYGWIHDDNETLTDWDVQVVPNNENCSDILLREFETVTPRFNDLYWAQYCQSGNPDDEICDPFIFDNESLGEKLEKIQKKSKEFQKNQEEQKQKEEEQKKEDNNKKIKYIAVACGVGVLVIVTGVVILKGRKKHE